MQAKETGISKIGKDGNDGNEASEVNARGEWSSQWDFAMSCIAYAVGLGNVWRYSLLQGFGFVTF